MMRSVCFVDRLELDFTGNHFSHAVALADADNDGLNELVIGNVDGILALFKGDMSSKPWKKCSGLGTVTCVGVGDVLNRGSNSIAVINTESSCSIFNIDTPDSKTPSTPQSPLSTPKTPSRSMKAAFVQTLPLPNAHTITFAQIIPDGGWEMCVGHTDRVVGIYRWNSETKQLELMQKFSLPGQIGCLSVSVTRDGTRQLLVSQPGGTYVPVMHNILMGRDTSKGSSTINQTKAAPFCLGDVIGQAQRRNPTSSTEVVGHINQSDSLAETGIGREDDSQRSNIVALCTLEGVVRFIRDGQKEWEHQVDHSLFSIGKLDITGNGSDEIVACAWDGTTYIVDHKRNCVRFHFDQNVSAFTCGCYGIGGKNVPCLVYTTFTNFIYLYRDITLPNVSSSNLLLTIQNMTLPSDLAEKLSVMDVKEKQKLLHHCLYEAADS